MTPSTRRLVSTALASVALVAAITAVIAVLDPHVPALGLAVLYLLAVVPITLAYGPAAASVVALASMAAFSFFFLHPRHSFNAGSEQNWEVLAAFLLSSLVISQLAARAQHEARRSARLADEQAALRHVATLVAQGVPPAEVFAAVAREVGRLLEVDATHVVRYAADGAATIVAAWSREGAQAPAGTRVALDGRSVLDQVRQTGKPARIASYDVVPGHAAALGRELGLAASVGTPSVVDRRPGGVLIASVEHGGRPLPDDAEPRIHAFTELVATAMSNAEARSEVQRLADEQAALRRVATLVAREAPPAGLFAAVAEEVSVLLGIEDTAVLRYEEDGTVTVVADANQLDPPIPTGARRPLEGLNLARMVQRTGRPARLEDAAGAPIVVEGRLWGVIVAGSPEGRLPAGSEERIAQFTELVATAISNVEVRRELAASRARIVAATDEERRRVVRDLHDGAQQRLVHTVVTLKLAFRALEQEQESVPALVREALDNAEAANVELRELAHGMLPTTLTRGGLRSAVATLVARAPLPVASDVVDERLPAVVEATAYFIVAEGLTNIAKHSRARHAEVTARIEDGVLAVHVRDDGVGGARGDGTGLTGLADRLAALDGELRVESPAGGGTDLAAAIPLGP